MSRVRSIAPAVIILIRHGQSVTNARSLLVGRSDPELSELGRRQARALAAHLDNVGELWVSPLRRARATAALAVENVEPVVKTSFVEVDYGILEGEPLSALSPTQWQYFERDHELAFGGGESLAAVDRRVCGELDSLLRDESSFLHSFTTHLVIVSHVSPIKSAVAWALGVGGTVAWRLRVDNGSLTTIGVRRGVPSLVRFNVVPALDSST